MGRDFIPNTFKRKNNKTEKLKQFKPHIVTKTTQVPISVSDEKWLDSFIGKIQFWSFGFFKVSKSTISTKFRIYTRKRIRRETLIPLVEASFPKGCRVYPVVGYKLRNTFDVILHRPMRWDEFVFVMVKALQYHL